ncbi:MAG: TIGR00725 family protein [Candidatus Marinimicrobia bacterium]|mgnify:CR=1 FL=1|nr:TIGR00725 family protein [Candidatus Neomarinimicrobiota bacterium]
MNYKARISVFGGREIDEQTYSDAVEIGRLLACENYLVYCGGGEGVMEAVAKGVKEGGGTCVAILKGTNTSEANDHIDISITTGMGIGRNVILAYNCDVAVAISGKYGTLSEIAYALQLEKPVVGYGTWDFEAIRKVRTTTEVINKVKHLLNGN